MALLNNIISYYKFDENTGSAVGDAAGSNTGTWNGTLGSQWTTGKINSGGNFNGTNNSVSSALWSSSTTNISFGGWFKSSDYTQTRQAIISNGDGAGGLGNYGYGLELSGNGTTDGSMYFIRHNIAWITLNFKVQDNNWHHIIATLDGSTNLSVYLDGVLKFGPTAQTLDAPTNNSYIGTDHTASGFFKGVLDEMGVWSRALTAGEVTQLYNAGNGLQYPFSLVVNRFWVAPTMDFYSTTLKGQISSGSTLIALASIGPLQVPGLVVIDRTNTATPPTSTPSVREVIGFNSIVSINILSSLSRGLDSSPTVAHSDGALIETNWTAGIWNSLTTIIGSGLDTQGLLNAINSPVSIAITQVGTNLNVSAASVTGFGFVPIFAGSGAYSGPTIAIGGLYIAPRAGTLKWVSAMTKYVASGTSVGFNFQVRGASIFANATTRPAISAGGTFVSTASIATTNINTGDILQGDVDSMLAGAGLIQEVTIQGGIN